jgi:hypothetical protein
MNGVLTLNDLRRTSRSYAMPRRIHWPDLDEDISVRGLLGIETDATPAFEAAIRRGAWARRVTPRPQSE